MLRKQQDVRMSVVEAEAFDPDSVSSMRSTRAFALKGFWSGVKCVWRKRTAPSLLPTLVRRRASGSRKKSRDHRFRSLSVAWPTFCLVLIVCFRSRSAMRCWTLGSAVPGRGSAGLSKPPQEVYIWKVK